MRVNDTLRATDPVHTGKPLLPRGGKGQWADLAFGSLSLRHSEALTTDGLDPGRHLAFLPAEALNLDLCSDSQRQFGDYELLEMIGEGGMGVVYRARQTSLDREVAVKLLSAGPWASRDFIERFQREAQNAARMQHPNIVAIHEVGAVDDMHFFSMRLIRGSSLAQKIREGPRLSHQRAAALLRTIAEAVDYAHRLGVLHLDLKPANVLLDESGEPHVADFGLARRLEPGSAADNTEISGTPSYMAPEQATPGVQKITTATDIWGLGAILYELVTGKPPFLGLSAQATLQQVTEGQLRSPRRYAPDLPRDLEAIIFKCMARSVADRYTSARALAEDLTRFIEGREVRARPLNRVQRAWRWARREPKFAASALLAVIALLAGLAATTQQWRRANANATRAEANALDAQASAVRSNEHLWEGRRETALRLMQDGRGLDALRPLVDNIEEQEQAGRVDPHSVERREIGMIRAQGVTLIDRMVVADAKPLAAGMSPDGSLLALGLSDLTVRWYDTASLTERGRVDIGGLPTTDGEEHGPRVLRFVDNHQLLVTLDWFDFLISPSHNNTYLVDIDHARVVDFPPQFKDVAEALFSADGGHALLHDRHGGVQLWQVDPWRPLAPRVQQGERTVLEWLLGRGARFVACKLSWTDDFLTLRDPHDLSVAHTVPLPALIMAWAESRDGGTLAIGDSRGHLFVIDTSTRSVRELPTPAGREVTWIAFSEDDAWLAAVRSDGAAFAFDVTSGAALAAGQMQDDFEPHEVAISRSERLLVATGLGETALWRLPVSGPNPREATRLLSAPTRTSSPGTNATAIALQARLLATTDVDGEVRLWRLPAAPLLEAQSGKQTTALLAFDGRRLADIAHDHVRIVAPDGTPRTEWLALPQPIRFAELVDDGRTLLATSGHELHVIDGASGRERRAPIDLPANPMRFAVAPEGSSAVLTFGINTGGFGERLIAFDPVSGERLGEALVHGPLHQFELSPDGRRLLAITLDRGAVDVFDMPTLRRIGTLAQDRDRPVAWGAFAGDQFWLLARDAEDAVARDADLFLWNPLTGAVGEHRRVSGGFPVGVATVAGKPFLATHDRAFLDPGSPNERSSSRLTRGEATSVFALSHDGRVLAHVFGWDVQLYDAPTLRPIGPPLHSSLDNVAMPLQLAFSPDDSYLLARHIRWMIWPVPAETQATHDLRALTELLNPVPGGVRVLALPDAAQREQLRRSDPGPPRAMETRPQPTVARMVGGYPIPARTAAAGPLQLDLTQAYTRAPDSVADMVSNARPGVSTYPYGVARIDGVDYDVRGVVESNWSRRDGVSGAARIRVPAVPIAAFHVLLDAPLATPATEQRDYAYLRLHYRDGSSATLPIRTRRDVPGLVHGDDAVRIGWESGDPLAELGASLQIIVSNPRLDNPNPQKIVESLELEAATAAGWSNPQFLAVTAEPVIFPGKTGRPEAEDVVRGAIQQPGASNNPNPQ